MARRKPAHNVDPGRQQATFTFPKSIAAGRATLKIQYTGILNGELRGFYLSKTATRNYAVTQFEPTDARRAFPSFDEPALKATFDVTLEIDTGDTAISNTAIISDKPGPDAGKHTLVFGTSPRMSTYLVAFLVGDFQCQAGEQDGVALRVCATPGRQESRLRRSAPRRGEICAALLRHLLRHSLSIEEAPDFIGIPDFEAGAMENFGAITFREEALARRSQKRRFSAIAEMEVATDVTHEMAHQ